MYILHNFKSLTSDGNAKWGQSTEDPVLVLFCIFASFPVETYVSFETFNTLIGLPATKLEPYVSYKVVDLAAYFESCFQAGFSTVNLCSSCKFDVSFEQ